MKLETICVIPENPYPNTEGIRICRGGSLPNFPEGRGTSSKWCIFQGAVVMMDLPWCSVPIVLCANFYIGYLWWPCIVMYMPMQTCFSPMLGAKEYVMELDFGISMGEGGHTAWYLLWRYGDFLELHICLHNTWSTAILEKTKRTFYLRLGSL